MCFPGWVDLGNSNNNIIMKRNNDTPMLLNELRGSASAPRLFGSVEFGISVRTAEGGTKHGIATVYLSGTADMASSPPKVSV